MNTEDISKFVIDFIEQHKDNSNIVKKWSSVKTQAELKKIIKIQSKESKESKKDKPKRGRSGYVIFCDEMRKTIKDEFPTIENSEILKKIGDKWNLLKIENPDEVQKYNKLSEIERQKYKENMEKYNSNKNLENKKSTKSKVTDEPTEPKINKDKSNVVEEPKVTKEEPKKQNVTKNKKETKKLKVIEDANEPNVVTDVKELKSKEMVKSNTKETNVDNRYGKYFKKKSKKIKKNDPDIKEEELSNKLLKKWNKLSEEEKDKFN
jgi:hypothetical protein